MRGSFILYGFVISLVISLVISQINWLEYVIMCVIHGVIGSLLVILTSPCWRLCGSPSLNVNYVHCSIEE